MLFYVLRRSDILREINTRLTLYFEILERKLSSQNSIYVIYERLQVVKAIVFIINVHRKPPLYINVTQNLLRFFITLYLLSIYPFDSLYKL